jgi:peptide chain release factor 3
MHASALSVAGMLSIGDSLHTGNKPLRFPGIPSFSPEKFAYIQNPNPSKYKNFRVRPPQPRHMSAPRAVLSLTQRALTS